MFLKPTAFEFHHFHIKTLEIFSVLGQKSSLKLNSSSLKVRLIEFL